MRITIALLVMSLHVNAGGFAQRLTVDVKNQPVSKVFREIEKQSNYRFVYSTEILPAATPVTLSVKNAGLDEVLQKLFSFLQLGYRLLPDRVVVVTEALPAAGPDKQIPPGTVRGRVTDAAGAPLEGATINIQGRSVSTVSDRNGDFSLTVEPGTYTLIISYAGFVNDTRTIRVADGETQTLTAALTARQGSLDEVVVIGYGEQSRRKVTSSITKIDGDNIARQRISNPGEGLAGLAPGVQVQSSSGSMPGVAPIIRVRGISTIGDNRALYVVDGYPLLDPNQFNLINSADIESIEVLKDAAAAAIYGSRGTNGVVIVTTKRGRSGKTRFELNVNSGFQEISKKVEVMNAAEFLKFSKEAAANRGIPYATVFDRPAELADTDWQDVIFRRAGFSEYQLTATGGSEAIRFVFSGGYLKQQGTLIGTSFERFNFRTNVDAKLTSKLRMGVNLAPSYYEQFKQPTAGAYNSSNIVGDGTFIPRNTIGIVHTALLMPPIIPARLPNGLYGQPTTSPPNPFGEFNYLANNIINPLAPLELNTHRTRALLLLAQAYLEYEPLKNLRLKSSFGTSSEFNEQYNYIGNNWNIGGPGSLGLTQPWSNETQGRGIDWLWENTASYNYTLGERHNLGGVAFYSIQKNVGKFNETFSEDNSFTQFGIQNPLGAGRLLGSLFYDRTAWYSYGGRFNYDFGGKYLLSASIRQDASSRFGPNKRSSVFPAGSIGWRITEEPFMRGLKPVLSDLKFRYSYGVTGNANIGSFAWAGGGIFTNVAILGGQRTFGAGLNGIINPDLTWERAKQSNVGVDGALFNNRFTFSADVFNKRNEDILFSIPVAGAFGTATSFTDNALSIDNKGFELQAGYNESFGPVRLNLNANFSRIRNEVIDLNGAEQISSNEAIGGWSDVFRIRKGDPLGNMYGYKVLGIYKNAGDLSRFPQWNGNGNTVGDWIMEDYNRDGRITSADMQVLGNAFPDFTYGFTAGLDFKGIDFSVLLHGQQGGNIVNGVARLATVGAGNFNAFRSYADNYFLPSQPDRDVVHSRLFSPVNSPLRSNNAMTNIFMEDASFLRIRNVTLGYTFTPQLLSRIKVQNARLYVSAQNLFTFSSYSGYNPEASMYGASAFGPGVDQGTYPLSRILTAGLTVGF